MADEGYVPPLASEPIFYSVPKWLQENEKFFLPPVCNKMMHNTQLKAFYVGGPNQRRDYHMEEGEEFFFMRKGDMCLKIVEGGRNKDVHIREGQVFLLPARIPHSPQRAKDTVGLVIERERLAAERDGLRYYMDPPAAADGEEPDKPTGVLFQRWFHCKDLGKELGPIIKSYFASEQHKTRLPIESDLEANPSLWAEDCDRRIEPPFDLQAWIQDNKDAVSELGSKELFDSSKYQTDAMILGKGSGKRTIGAVSCETFLWQIRSSSKVTVEGQPETTIMAFDDVGLIPVNSAWQFDPEDEESMLLALKMDPKNRARVGHAQL